MNKKIWVAGFSVIPAIIAFGFSEIRVKRIRINQGVGVFSKLQAYQAMYYSAL
jgi:hypothetical protein